MVHFLSFCTLAACLGRGDHCTHPLNFILPQCCSFSVVPPPSDPVVRWAKLADLVSRKRAENIEEEQGVASLAFEEVREGHGETSCLV